MDLNKFPPAEPGESLDDYLWRVLDRADVSLGTLAEWLDVNRAALYKIKNGGGITQQTLVRFGATVGALQDDPDTVSLLDLLGLLADARAGWTMRAWLLQGTPEAKAEMMTARSAARSQRPVDQRIRSTR